MNVEYKSKSKVEKPYCWGNYETRQEQRTRMRQTMELISKESETILCVSHGGPITHLYEELTGNSWSEHGESTYTCISIYVQESLAGEWKTLIVNDSTHVHESE
jgi:broad specificity phosphatase PhoE